MRKTTEMSPKPGDDDYEFWCREKNAADIRKGEK